MQIETIITSAATAGSLTWVLKSWLTERLKNSIQHEYATKLEGYKLEVKSTYDTELEKLRSQLTIESAKRNVEYSRIHERRLEIISEIASRLDALHQAVSEYVSPMEWESTPPKSERRVKVGECLGEFNLYYRPRRFFLPPDLITKIEAFRKQLHQHSVEFMLKVEQDGAGARRGEDHMDTWLKVSKYADDEAPKIIADLEDEFRNLLGMITEKKEPNKAMERSRVAVTDCAGAHSAPATRLAHL